MGQYLFILSNIINLFLFIIYYPIIIKFLIKANIDIANIRNMVENSNQLKLLNSFTNKTIAETINADDSATAQIAQLKTIELSMLAKLKYISNAPIPKKNM